ncbi:MAG: site-specific integrase [Bacteroidota bacterium]
MASSVKIIWREDKINRKGEAPLYLRLIKNRTPKYIALGIVVHKDNWDEDNKRVKKGMRNSQRINNLISNKFAEAENQALELETHFKDISSSKIKENIMGKASVDFFEYCTTYFKLIKGKIAGSTYDKADGVIKKMKEYAGNKSVAFEQLTVLWLKEYECFMRSDKKDKKGNPIKGNKNNTIFANMKIIRRIVNEAVRDKVIKYDENPFLHYKCKWEKTVKNFCAENELEAIENIELEPETRIFNTRNAYILSSYAGGLRISDVCKLKKRNYDGERIFIYTKKCKGVPVSIKLPQKAIDIMNIYCKPSDNPDHFVFPFLSNDIDYSNEDFLTKAIDSQDTICNKALKDIADYARLDKHITFHTSRHTWATRALRKGMRIEYVSKLMGHSDIKTTQIYAQIVNEELDNAMDVFNEPITEYGLITA